MQDQADDPTRGPGERLLDGQDLPRPASSSIVRIVQTCESCPSQWEGFLADGRAFYIRFRWGHLRMTAHATHPHMPGADVLLDEYDEGDGLIGVMPYDELRRHLRLAGITVPVAMESPRLSHPSIVPAIREMVRSRG